LDWQDRRTFTLADAGFLGQVGTRLLYRRLLGDEVQILRNVRMCNIQSELILRDGSERVATIVGGCVVAT
jgi:hypothetical protein